MRKRIFTLALCCAVAAAFLPLCGCGSGEITFLDSGGKPFGTYSGEFKLKDDKYLPYASLALNEAETALKKDGKQIKKLNCSIKTLLDTEAQAAVQKALENVDEEKIYPRAAVMNLKGGIIAAAGDYAEKDINPLSAKTYPGSTIKPLSVYTPAIENGLICWSSMQNDSPLKKVKGEDGTDHDWPVNADGEYSEKNVTVKYSLQKSLNTTAVKWMKKLTVEKSMDFLKNSFGLPLNSERKISLLSSDEEIIGNVALGYIADGVSLTDMAGYYQIFANGGKYTTPYTVEEITDAGGKTLYTAAPEEKQVISPKTAYIMNRLLLEVVSPGATGKNAAVSGIAVGGKTGTTDKNADNWFVGFTPAVTCAVWHGGDTVTANGAPEIFAEIIGGLSPPDNNYPHAAGVLKRIYCGDSGGLISGGCPDPQVGWFDINNLPEQCTKH